MKSLTSDVTVQRDVLLGRRIGFYRMKGEVGTGNFSQVKIAVHCLTKGQLGVVIFYFFSSSLLSLHQKEQFLQKVLCIQSAFTGPTDQNCVTCFSLFFLSCFFLSLGLFSCLILLRILSTWFAGQSTDSLFLSLYFFHFDLFLYSRSLRLFHHKCCRDSNGQAEKVAIKILDKSKLDVKTQRMLTREIYCMEKLHHPNLVRLFEVIETLTKVYLVLEYAPFGELAQRINDKGRLKESTSAMIFAQIVSAIDHMVRKVI